MLMKQPLTSQLTAAYTRNMTTSDYSGVLLEQIYDQNKAVLEAVGDMRQQVMHIPAMREDIAELKTDMKIVKSALTDLSKSHNALEGQVTRLERHTGLAA